MAYSKIERNFWETDEAMEMTPEEKMFWIYLQTNANVNTLGCYAFRIKKAEYETGFNTDTVKKLLDRMKETGRILYDKEFGEVFLLCWPEIYWNKNTNTKRALTADLKEIQSKMLKEMLKMLLSEKGIFAKDGAEMPENKGSDTMHKDRLRHNETNRDSAGEEEEEEEEEKKYISGKSAEFILFWEAYPNKKNKQVAIKRWDAMKITPERYREIMAGLERAKNSQEWAEKDGKYIPHPASWLNAGGWENEYRPKDGVKPVPAPGRPPQNDALDRRRQMMGG